LIETLRKLTESYAVALRAYLDGQGEAALLKAYDLGRAALAAKLSVLEVSTVHQVALVRTLLERLAPEERARIEKAASEFSAESLIPFELSAQGAREANQVLQHLNDTLAEKNAEIERQLAALRELQQLKDDLMSLIVHDLRNPLSGMISCLDLLKPSADDDDAATREVFTLAREGARKLSELIDDLLEVRKLEEGKLEVKLEPVLATEIVDEAIATLSSTARLEEVLLDVQVDDAALGFPGDRRLLRRVVENLVSNAIKFSRRNDTVTVVARAEGERAIIEVLDRGPGVAEELRAHLFQKFGSLEARSRGGRRGFGLGLYFVKLVATAHGGSATVEAREGGGSVFRVALPRR